MLANLATSILDKERVTTTVTKAKEIRSTVERLITYGKRNTVHAIRLVAKKVNDKTVIKKLFDDIAPGYKDREGGYTRIIRKGFRKGDNAELAIIELVGRNSDTQRKRKKKKKSVVKTSTPKTVKEKTVKNKKDTTGESPKHEESLEPEMKDSSHEEDTDIELNSEKIEKTDDKIEKTDDKKDSNSEKKH
jgi:large subunit ribosomal protein L17